MIGRVPEREHLGSLWAECRRAGAPRLVVLYGRRRVGKTYLCLDALDAIAAEGGRTVYFNATRESEGIQLARFADALERDLGPAVQGRVTGPFRGWEAAFEFLFTLAADAPLAVVIDEVSYLTDGNAALPSILQAAWDRHTVRPSRREPLLLVLTGSAIGVVRSLLDAGGPLFRRASWEHRLDPLPLPAVTAFFPGSPADRVVEAYAACGGFPLYLRAWDIDRPTKDNLLRLAGSPGAILLEDAPSVVRDEIGDVAGFARVLTAVGLGRTRRSSIQADAGQRIELALSTLERSGLIRRAVPLRSPRKVTPFYEVADPYLRFWFSVLYREAELIQGGQGKRVLERVMPAWRQHVGWVFEEAARAHAAREVGHSLPAGLEIGRWWDAKGQNEVDVLGLDGDRTALVGEARWSTRPIDVRDIAALLAKARYTPGFVDEPLVALWSRSDVPANQQPFDAITFTSDDMCGDPRISAGGHRRR